MLRPAGDGGWWNEDRLCEGFGGEAKEQEDIPSSRAVVACIRKWRMLQKGAMRASQVTSTDSGRIEMSEQAACRQSLPILVRRLARDVISWVAAGLTPKGEVCA